MNAGNTLYRTKEERRSRALCYKGGRQVIEWTWGAWTFPFVVHPNRVMRQFRLSNRSLVA